MSKYRVSRKAASDLRSIARYTQDTWGAVQRRKYLEGLDSSFRRLAAMPQLAAQRYDIDPPVRIFRYESHLIVYVEEDSGVLILRVRHHSEDWMDAPL
ncbi:type II toxin-antitoxin system RelE/ParE family toxin [Salipiger abyssi]|uniref:type II toxin-antitoxin system RelE/ParE family toxin n=1 Tax=Salipiger abyssi TaxID=1250539 RepID=UPI001A8DD3B9|nr:type II toxin-antitoxin system RelE/ParE family toxin [Salipiger abyssi]MBN9890159.1 type II toxin-antitoxin system RelE/ParE family toxin [Salipiger abyssi]